MSNAIDDCDYQKFAILFVDDEANARKYFRRLFGEKFRILEAGDGAEALTVFRKHAAEIGVIVTDQRMPNETGIELLSKIAEEHPDVVKILSTAYADIDTALGSINQGRIYHFMTKPWDIPKMEVTLRRAMEFFMMKRERDALLGTKMQVVGDLMLSSRLAAFALVPVCAGIPCKRASEAIASFIRIGSASDASPVSAANDWKQVHDRQIQYAAALEARLQIALAVDKPAARIAALASELEAAVSLGTNGKPTVLSCSSDPGSILSGGVLGRTDEPTSIQASVNVLAAFMAIYDAGGTIRRLAGDVLSLEILESSIPVESSSPGAEVVKWLIGDDSLIQSVLGTRS